MFPSPCKSGGRVRAWARLAIEDTLGPSYSQPSGLEVEQWVAGMSSEQLAEEQFCVPLNDLLGLAGVEHARPQVARCLLIDPPAGVVDLIADWAIAAIAANPIRPSALAEAIAVQISAIGRVRPERDRLVLRLLGGGLPMGAAMTIADNWIDFGASGSAPERSFQSVIHFGNSPEPAADLVGLLRSGRVRELLYVGDAGWTIDLAGAAHRAELVEFLTVQAAIDDERLQLLKFEVSRNRPPRVALRPRPGAVDQWSELGWWEAARHSVGVPVPGQPLPRLSRWKSTELPRPMGYESAPWVLPSQPVAKLFRRLDRHYSRLRPEDVRLGANEELDSIWLTDSTEFGPDEAVPFAALKNLRGGAEFGHQLDRVVRTRDAHNTIRGLDEMSDELRSWIFGRTERFATMIKDGLVPDDELWWGSPWADIPQGSFVGLPVFEEHGDPTVFEAGTMTAPGILWFEPKLLGVEACAALLTSGPVRDQIRTLSPVDAHGRPVVSLEILAALKLPRRIHPLVEEDLVRAYRIGDKREIARVANEIYTGNERSLLNNRESDAPSLFGYRHI